jgi:D-sedoheptulose 7-phosphate isomerase
MDCVLEYIRDVREVLEQLPMDDIRAVMAALHHARLNDKQVFIMGNGGSAATASHFACDLGKGTRLPGAPHFRVIALTDNIPLMLAYANDVGYEYIFAEQIASLGLPGDIVIGISGSGNSPNVLRAVEAARLRGATTVGFTGFDGGKLKGLVDMCVVVPSRCMEQVEDVHLMLEHLICTGLRQMLPIDVHSLRRDRMSQMV